MVVAVGVMRSTTAAEVEQQLVGRRSGIDSISKFFKCQDYFKFRDFHNSSSFEFLFCLAL